MTALKDLCLQVRSKNAGPFWLTIDLFMPGTETYERVTHSAVISPGRIATMYAVDPAGVRVFLLPELHAVKISFPRPTGQGSLRDRDIHSGQQYVPLLELEIP